MTQKITKEDCAGCENDFYNCGGVNGNTKNCWSFERAEMTLGRVLSIHTLPKHYSGKFKPIPSCYNQKQYFVERK